MMMFFHTLPAGCGESIILLYSLPCTNDVSAFFIKIALDKKAEFC